ncbi:YjbE family putative metal transport protein [Dictyobacter arantiisoli]|uniref:Membrane protein n=1 Tax=Dictyobacter arantiisoli TaxID=2014874 RepID=A0A5A5TE85_9CHLR|nr:YjbE family putative metal transport protein [Dictyobacter arantiisoli]GCF09456.1 membrane protein [Dictyobacter arantiisoli]
MLQWVTAIGGIVLSDLVLSGDNALVIGAAAAGLPRQQRYWAIMCGGGGAIVLRILFAIVATILLQIPYLGVFGGIILLYIAIRLLLDRSKEARKSNQERLQEQEELTRRGAGSFWTALTTILVADATMSLDNVLAVGALAEGNILFLVIGLILSIGILLLGSSLLAKLMDHLPWLLDVACLVLALTASHILLGDDSLQTFFEALPWIKFAAPALAIMIVAIADVYLRRRDKIVQQRLSA